MEMVYSRETPVPKRFVTSYAHSFARLKFFQTHFVDDNLTIETESRLLEIHEARLRSRIIMAIGSGRVEFIRKGLEKSILFEIQRKLEDVSDKTTADIIMGSIDSKSFNDLFSPWT